MGLIAAGAVLAGGAGATTTWAIGDVFAGIGSGKYNVYSNAGAYKETIDGSTSSAETTGCSFNPALDKLYTTGFTASRVVVFNDASPHAISQTIDPTLQGGAHPESVVFAANGDFYVGHADGNADIQRFDAAGAFQQQYNVATDARGSDWMDLAADQKTMFYTSEGRLVKRYDVSGAGAQLANFATLPSTGNAFALRLLPPGDGSAGLLVADRSNVKRLDSAGAVVQTYDVTGEDYWFSLNLDPNGTSFWAGGYTTRNIYRFNIATGSVEVGPVNTGALLSGICVKGEHTAAVNGSPVVSAGSDVSGNEGSAISLDGTVTDPDGDTVTTLWTYAPLVGVDAGATCTFANAAAVDTTITCTDDGTYTATLTGNDGKNAAVSDSAAVTVANVAPTVDITAPADGQLYAINTPVNLSANLADAGTNDTHTCSINWDNGSTDTGTVTETAGSGTCTGSKMFTVAGIYTIAVTVTDDDGASATDTVMVVVYDPNAGFVTGGGWINSPAGAYAADLLLTGRANFGFVSKYKKGATVPTGETEFQFQAGSFNFHSEAYQWLVVAGCKAQYKGTGTVNGVTGYGFLLTATDGNICSSKTTDKFRIKVWKVSDSSVVYDNKAGTPVDIDVADPQEIAGGQIVIHK